MTSNGRVDPADVFGDGRLHERPPVETPVDRQRAFYHHPESIGTCANGIHRQ